MTALNFSNHKKQNDGAHRGDDKLSKQPIRNEMQQAKQASAQQGTDDSDDHVIDDSLTFPFCDQACEPAGHQTNQQEPNNIHSHTSSLPVCGGVLPLVFWCQDRIVATLKYLAAARISWHVQISETIAGWPTRGARLGKEIW